MRRWPPTPGWRFEAMATHRRQSRAAESTMTSATRMMGDTRARRPITGARIIRVWWWGGSHLGPHENRASLEQKLFRIREEKITP